MSKTLFVSVFLDQNLQKPLDYSVPFELQSLIQVGSRVEVPLKSAAVKGTVAALMNEARFKGVKPILKILSHQKELSDTQWKLAEWMSQYYATPLQKVLKCFIPPHVRKETRPKSKLFATLMKSHEETISYCEKIRGKNSSQALVLDLLLQNPKGLFLSEILEAKGSRSSVQTLCKQKWIVLKSLSTEDDLLLDGDFFPTKPKILNGEQKEALSSIESALDSGKFSPHLIYGITGSGKTEIYLQAIAKSLSLQKSAMLLVPEIALTSQTIERIKTRFSEKIAILHHKRSLGERTSSWDDLKSGKIRLVIGARSAIFCPVQNLGLIIVDEEHDGSYKQSDEMPCYQGRDVAVMRAHLENCTILLGSATPSIESRHNAAIGKYKLHTLRSRATKANLPKVSVVDMKSEMDRNGGFTHFSEKLLSALKERVLKGEQALLLLNRRGYHRMQLCASCRSIVKCPHCDLSLTFHKAANELKCHVCHFSRPAFRKCPDCGDEGSMEFKGFGTEHVERSLKAILPEIRTLRMDRDTTQKKEAHEELFKQFRSHKADVLIGTQMIAKGFHFPSVTLVGVLNIDASLSIPDFRSPEHAFQLLIQVFGRSGRSDLPGEVVLQTFMPEHPIFQLASKQDYDAFYEAEIEERRTFGYPPFSHLAKLTFSSSDESACRNNAEEAQKNLQQLLGPNAHIFPVSPSGHSKIKDMYRFQFLIKTARLSFISAALSSFASPHVKIDVDPLSTFF